MIYGNIDVSCQENISIKMIIDDLPDIEYRAVMTDHPISGSPLPFFDSNHTSQAGAYAAGHPLLSGEIFVKYREGIHRFLDKGGMFGWGIVPANYDEFITESTDGLIHRIETLWRELEKAGFDLRRILSQSILMPATCALMNPDGFDTVEKAYDSLKNISRLLQTKYLQSSS